MTPMPQTVNALILPNRLPKRHSSIGPPNTTAKSTHSSTNLAMSADLAKVNPGLRLKLINRHATIM